MLVRVGLTDCVNVCACVSSSRVRGAGSVCIEFLSMFGRPLAPRPAGPSSPSPRAPTPSLSRSSSFSFPHSLVLHVASGILYDQGLHDIWICANVTLINMNICFVPSSPIYCFGDFKTLYDTTKRQTRDA